MHINHFKNSIAFDNYNFIVSTCSDNIGQQYQAAVFQIRPKNRAKVTKFYLNLATCWGQTNDLSDLTRVLNQR